MAKEININDMEPAEIVGLKEDGDDVLVPIKVAYTEKQFRDFYNKLKPSHLEWCRDLAALDGQFNGNPPRDPEDLKKHGLDYLSNFNNGYARVILQNYLSNEFNLLHAVPYLINFKLSLGKKDIDEKMGKILSKHWHNVYTSWEDFHNTLDTLRQERAKFGIGIILREGWKFKSIDPADLLFPDSVQFRQGSLSMFAIRHQMSQHELFNLAEESKDNTDFWKKEAILEVLLKVSNLKHNSEVRGFDKALKDLQDRFRRYDGQISTVQKEDVELVSVFTKEWETGKWSHGVIHESISTEEPLFYHNEQFENLKDFFQIFPFAPGEKFVKANKGLLHRIFSSVEVMNRLDNLLVDQAHMASTVLVRNRGGRGKDLKQVKILPGTFCDIGEAEIVQNFATTNMQGAIAASQYQKGILQMNNQMEGFDIGQPDEKFKTYGQVMYDAAQHESVITKPQINFFYGLLDTFWKKTVDLCLQEKDDFYKRWVKLCKEDGDKIAPGTMEVIFDNIEKKTFKDLLEISAYRSTSSGSKGNDIMMMQRMGQLAPFMSGESRFKYLQLSTSANADYSYIDLFFPDTDAPTTISAQKQLAVLENGILEQGKEAVLSQTDAHFEHVPVHFTRLLEIINEWGQGADLIETRDKFVKLFEHATAHWTLLQKDPFAANYIQGLGSQYGEITNQGRKISFDAAAQEQAQQDKQKKLQIDELNQQVEQGLKIRAADFDEYIKNREVDAKINLESRKNDLHQQALDAKNSVEQEIQARQFVQNSAIKQANAFQVNKQNATK